MPYRIILFQRQIRIQQMRHPDCGRCAAIREYVSPPSSAVVRKIRCGCRSTAAQPRRPLGARVISLSARPIVTPEKTTCSRISTGAVLWFSPSICSGITSIGGADTAPMDYGLRIISELNRQFLVSVINGRNIYAKDFPVAVSWFIDRATKPDNIPQLHERIGRREYLLRCR